MFRRIQELQLGLEHRRSCPYQKLIRPSHHAATRREASLAYPVVWHSPCRCMSGYTPHRLAVEEPRHTLIVPQPSPQLVREGIERWHTDAEGPHLTANAPAGGDMPPKRMPRRESVRCAWMLYGASLYDRQVCYSVGNAIDSWPTISAKESVCAVVRRAGRALPRSARRQCSEIEWGRANRRCGRG
jgi:hypothetical protein